MGLGWGYLSCGSCVGSVSGGIAGLSLYVPFNDRLLVGLGTTGYYRSLDGVGLTAGTVDARLRYTRSSDPACSSPVASASDTSTSADQAGYGLGLVYGLGWDVPVGPNLSLTPFWNGIGVANTNGSVSVGQLGLGVTVHHRRIN